MSILSIFKRKPRTKPVTRSMVNFRYVCGWVLFALLAGAVLWTWFVRSVTFITHAPEDIELTLNESSVMESSGFSADYGLGEVKLRRGTKVRFLGLRNDKVWVETEGGDRGFIYGEAFDREWIVYERFARRDSLPFGEPIVLKERDKYGKAKYVRPDGSAVEKVEYIDAVPQLLWEYRKYGVGGGNSEYVTEKSFARYIKGKTLEEVDRRYGKALQVRRKGDKTYASYGIGVFDRKTGIRYQPVVIFENGLATQYAHSTDGTYKRNRWLLSVLPLSGKIISAGSGVISEPRFDSFNVSAEHSTSAGKYEMEGAGRYLLLPVALIVGLLMLAGWLGYYLFVPTAVIWIIFFLLGKPQPLKNASERVMKNIGIFTFVPMAYIWFVLMSAGEQSVWWLVLPGIVGAFYFSYRRLSKRYDDATRCADCKNINTLVFDHSEEHDGGIEWGTSSSLVKSRSWSTGEQVPVERVEITYESGRKEIKYNYKTRYKDTNHYNDYDVKYQVYIRVNFYKCSICGHVHEIYDVWREEISRKYTGSHTETSSHLQ